MASEARWRQAEAYARKVRLEMFGDREPPYRRLSDAVQWIRDEHETGITQEYVAQSQALTALSDRLYRQLRDEWDLKPPGQVLEISLKNILIEFPGKDNWNECVPATTDRLVRLAEETRYLGQYLGMPDALATAFLLTGQQSNFRIRIRRTFSPGFNRVGVFPGSHTIEVDAESGADPDEVADAWRDRFPPRPSPLEQAILDLVEEARADGLHPPTPTGKQGRDAGVRKYWEAVLQRWKNDPDKYPLYPYKTWDGLRKRYDKIRAQEGANRHDKAW